MDWDANRLRERCRAETERVRMLGSWPDHVDARTLFARVPSSHEPGLGGFDAGVACALDLVPRARQRLACRFHAAYDAAGVAQARSEALYPDADSETTWWLAASSVAREAVTSQDQFFGQLDVFEELRADAPKRLRAAEEQLRTMLRSVDLGGHDVPLGATAGSIAGAYLLGWRVAASRGTGGTVSVGTCAPSLRLDDFSWSQPDDAAPHPLEQSGPVWGSRQFVRCADEDEFLRLVAHLAEHTPDLLQRDTSHATALLELERVLAPGSESTSGPILVALSGLPGTGKSAVAKALEQRHVGTRVASDVVRRHLVEERTYSAIEGGIVYEAVHGIAMRRLRLGEVVIIDATNRYEDDIRKAEQLAAQASARFLHVRITADPATVYARIRERGDATESEADWSVYARLAQEQRPVSPVAGELDTSALGPDEAAGLLAAVFDTRLSTADLEPANEFVRRMQSVSSSISRVAPDDLEAYLAVAAPAIVDQVRSDANDPGLLAVWGTSKTLDRGDPAAPVIPPELMEALSRTAEQPFEWPLAHAGLLHAYAYAMSRLRTVHGGKRDRWLHGEVAYCFGVPATVLSPQPPVGTLLSNLTGLLVGLEDNSALRGAYRNSDAGLRRIVGRSGNRPFSGHRIVEEVHVSGPHGRTRLRLWTDLLTRTAPKDVDKVPKPVLLVYSMEGPDDMPRRLITAFPVTRGFAHDLLQEPAGNDVRIRLDYNAAVATYEIGSQRGTRTIAKRNVDLVVT